MEVTFTILHEYDVEIFIEHINSIEPHIRLTIEFEKGIKTSVPVSMLPYSERRIREDAYLSEADIHGHVPQLQVTSPSNPQTSSCTHPHQQGIAVCHHSWRQILCICPQDVGMHTPGFNYVHRCWPCLTLYFDEGHSSIVTWCNKYCETCELFQTVEYGLLYIFFSFCLIIPVLIHLEGNMIERMVCKNETQPSCESRSPMCGRDWPFYNVAEALFFTCRMCQLVSQ